MTSARPSASARATPEFFSTRIREAQRFYLDLNPPRGRTLAVVCGGWERCAPDYAIHRPSFPYLSLEYVVQGRGTVALGGRRHPLEPGRLFAYGPGTRQDIVADPDDPPFKYFVDFTGRNARALLRSCGLPPGTVGRVFPPTALQTLFDELVRAGQQASRHSGPLCVRLLECLALRLADAQAPVTPAESLAFRTYQLCRQHIQEHYARLRTLAEIARECRVNGAYICRLFRRYDSQTPYQYLRRLKITEAAALLEDPRVLAKQAGEAVGFDDPFHFSRAFKAVLGLSPDHFRRLR